MASTFGTKAWRHRMLNPPKRLIALKPHQATMPPSIRSLLVPLLKADTFHACAGLIRRANASKSQKARRLRARALNVLKTDLADYPRFKPYLGSISYDPSKFTGQSKDWAAFTQGWSDAKTAAGKPQAFLNHDAFTSIMKLTTVVHHEGPGHLRQRNNPAVFKPPKFDESTLRKYWHLAEVDAHLNDLRHRKALGMTPLIKSFGLNRAQRSWSGMSERHRSSLRNYFTGTRGTITRELHNTAFRNPPSYSQFGESHSFRLRNYARGLNVTPTMFPSTLKAMGRGLY